MTSRPLLYAFAAVVTLCAAAAPARAQDAKKKAEDLNRAAMEDYDLLEFENARRQLNEALQVLRKAKLDKDKVAAKTHVNLGIVLGGGLGDAGAAIGAFKMALEIDPNAKIEPAYRSAELNAMLDEAKAGAGAGAGAGGGGGGGGEGGEPPGGSDLVEHTPVEEAKPGKPLTITAKVSPDAKARQVVVMVRPGGADGYGELTMAGGGGTGGTYKAQIPADAVRGDSIHYYIEVRGAGGKVIASVGTSDSPNIVSLGGGGGGGGDSENPFGGGSGDGDGGGDDGGDDGDTAKGGPSFYLAVAAGTGGGYVSGSTEKAGTSVSGCPNCFAPELFHIKPELGFWISARTSIAVIIRIGMPIGANVEGAATIAPAVLVKLSRVISKDLSWHGDVGGGFMRQTITLEDMTGPNVDTHATGPLLVGGGLTWSKPLTKSTRMLVDGTALMGLPIVKEIGTARPNFGLSIDLSLGVAMAF